MNTYVYPKYTPTFSIGFLKHYAITMRPYLLFVSGITGIVGMSFIDKITFSPTVLIFAASFLAYGFGQALTDCFQIDTDSISSPYRPLTQGIISRNQVLIVSISGLIFCVAVFTVYNPLNLILGVVSGVGLATYTPFKRRWWGGPFYNSWIVALLCVMAFVCGGNDAGKVFSTPFVWALGAVFFAYANFVLSGYFKDIEADRATGYNTLPVVFGRKVSVLVSDIFAVQAIAFAFPLWIQGQLSPITHPVAFLFAVAAVATSIVGQMQLHRVTKDEEAHRAISLVVHTYILLFSSIAALQKPTWQMPLVVFYGAFVLVMKLRPAQSQV